MSGTPTLANASLMKKASQPVNRVFLDEPQKFGNRARPSFVKAGIQDATLTKTYGPRNEVALVLRGSGGEAVGGNQIALPFVIGQRDTYWISAKLVLEPYQDKYALKSISISVFKGAPRTEKSSILRAEWDCPVSITNLHAQPHWHAYPPTPLDVALETQNYEVLKEKPAIFELPEENQTSPIAYPDPFKKIHLAMSATWHLTQRTEDRVKLTSEAEVFAWIENCTKYLKQQFCDLC